ncbi:MAG: plasmid pRiA4b ORF-3 family protein [Chloroflexi bacterium]|nr:plasmid pRiA4b ORF-3 family protein [Chloroflexota bacterium]
MTQPTPPSMQRRVEAILREAGPLTVDELVARLAMRQPTPVKKDTVRNAASASTVCEFARDGRYCYMPTFVSGATVPLAMDLVAPEKGLVAVGAEVYALLWPMPRWQAPERTPRLALDGGPEVTLEVERGLVPFGLRFPMTFPAAFWQWWEVQQQAGADMVLLHCRDGEAGRYTATAAARGVQDPAAVAARNAQLRETAGDALKRTRGLRPDDLARRLLARGAYHGSPTPGPLYRALFQEGAFFLDRGLVTYRPDITPAWREVFAPRIEAELWLDEDILREVMELPELEEPEEEPAAGPELPEPPATLGYRLKVSLGWNKRVWRVLEILDNQTLEDLHDTILEAFGWDDDHLYSFFLSGRPWDPLPEVTRPYDEAEPPTADEVTLADLELRPKQRFLYIFDFGDQLHHLVEVVGAFPVPAEGEFPRMVESQGEAPPQYSSWDDEDGETEGDEEP